MPWPLPDDDLDLIAFIKWFDGDAGAYQLLMRKAFELPPDCKSAIRRWLTDVSKDIPPQAPNSTDISQRLGRIEAAIGKIVKPTGTRGSVGEAKAN